MKTLTVFSACFALIGAVVVASNYLDSRICHTFASTGTSHIRFNNCTGEAHVIVRGPNGFEWQVVR